MSANHVIYSKNRQQTLSWKETQHNYNSFSSSRVQTAWQSGNKGAFKNDSQSKVSQIHWLLLTKWPWWTITCWNYFLTTMKIERKEINHEKKSENRQIRVNQVIYSWKWSCSKTGKKTVKIICTTKTDLESLCSHYQNSQYRLLQN